MTSLFTDNGSNATLCCDELKRWLYTVSVKSGGEAMVVEYYSHREGLNWTTNQLWRPVRTSFGPETFKNLISATWPFKSSGMLCCGVGYFLTFRKHVGGSIPRAKQSKKKETRTARLYAKHHDPSKRCEISTHRHCLSSKAFKRFRILAWSLWKSNIRRVNCSKAHYNS